MIQTTRRGKRVISPQAMGLCGYMNGEGVRELHIRVEHKKSGVIANDLIVRAASEFH